MTVANACNPELGFSAGLALIENLPKVEKKQKENLFVWLQSRGQGHDNLKFTKSTPARSETIGKSISGPHGRPVIIRIRGMNGKTF